jgi:hypothetical protein
MFPIFTTKAAESQNSIERMKLFIASTISSFYYMNLFLKPVSEKSFSLIQFSVRHFRHPTLTELKSTVNKFHTTLQSATFSSSVPTICTGITATTITRPRPGLTL